MNMIFHELTKSLQKQFMSHSIILNLYSDYTTDCAYKGLHFTITKIIKNLQAEKCNIELQDYKEDSDVSLFAISRCTNNVTYFILLTAYKIDNKNQILFEFTMSSY